MNDAEIRHLIEQVRRSAAAQAAFDPADVSIPLLTEVVPPEAFETRRGVRQSSGPMAAGRSAQAPRPPAPEARTGGSASAREESRAAQDRRADDETRRVALEARIVEQVLARLCAEAQPVDTVLEDFVRPAAERLAEELVQPTAARLAEELVRPTAARLTDAIVEELKRSLVPALRQQLERRVHEAVHEALCEEFDHRPSGHRRL